MSNEATEYDPFWRPREDSPTQFYRAKDGWSARQGSYQTVEMATNGGDHIPTPDDAAHAIAGVLQLWQHPQDDLHAYAQYVEAASIFVRQIEMYQRAAVSLTDVTPNPDLGPDFARAYGDCDTTADNELDAALKGYWEGDAPAAVEEKRPRSLEEILGQ